ncbi:MAG: complex I subunit 5 family protein [Candidatus Bathyarchaeia archaeon]
MSFTVLSLLVIPTLGAASAPLVGPRSRRARDVLLVFSTSLALAVNSFYLHQATFNESFSPPTFGPMFVDAPGLLVSEIIFGLGLLVNLYSFAYMRAEADNDAYYAVFMLFLASMVGMVFTYNVAVLLVFLEASTVMSAVLILYGRSQASVRATAIYLAISIAEALFVLSAIVVMYTQVGTVDILDLPSKNLAGSSSLALTLALLFTIGFGTKAALIPLGPLWLPPAHGEAPSSVSAMLSGVMIKLGAVAMARTLFALYPIVGATSMSYSIGGVGVVTMVAGILWALFARDLKRLLAWSSVSQMGYVVMGIGLGTPLGVAAGLFHLLNHAVFKSLLFLCSGSLQQGTGTRRMDEMGGVFSKMPVTATLFLLGAASISGVPPFNGFYSKSLLHEASAEAGIPAFGTVSIGVSILTLLCYAYASYRMFFRGARGGQREASEAPFLMLAPMVILASLCVILGVYPDVVWATLSRAATALRAPIGGSAHA